MDMTSLREKIEQKPRNTVIIVASLIQKPANLGGLCRTCETFNAELLVVDDLKCTADALFLSTSVTASAWMPMKQVPESGLTGNFIDCRTFNLYSFRVSL